MKLLYLFLAVSVLMAISSPFVAAAALHGLVYESGVPIAKEAYLLTTMRIFSVIGLVASVFMFAAGVGFSAGAVQIIIEESVHSRKTDQ